MARHAERMPCAHEMLAQSEHVSIARCDGESTALGAAPGTGLP